MRTPSPILIPQWSIYELVSEADVAAPASSPESRRTPKLHEPRNPNPANPIPMTWRFRGPTIWWSNRSDDLVSLFASLKCRSRDTESSPSFGFFWSTICPRRFFVYFSTLTRVPSPTAPVPYILEELLALNDLLRSRSAIHVSDWTPPNWWQAMPKVKT